MGWEDVPVIDPQRRRLLTAALAAAVAAGVAVAAASSPGATTAPEGLHGNNFFSNCRFSHTASDDPIVYPGQPGRSHSHTFFGNTSSDARSTLASLRGAATTCKPRADRAAYWVPTLYENGREVRPAKGQFYYVVRGFRHMRPFPAGLRMIAGDAHAHRAQPMNVAYWTCGGQGGVRLAPSATVPSCGVVRTEFTAFVKDCSSCPLARRRITRFLKTYLELHVNFPDCWDGKRLDSADHMSHMAYSRAYVCPRSHPVKVPLIRVMVRYPIAGGRGVALASGGQLSGHADFFNAWDEHALAKLVDDCFHDRPCNRPPAR
jgi:hypothetical protein